MRQHLSLIGKNILSQGLGTVTSLGFTILAARFLSVHDYGELRYVMTLLPLLAALSLPGYDSIILRQSNLREYIPLLSILIVRIAGGLAGTAVVLAVLLTIPDKISETLRFFLISTALLLPLFEVATGYRNYLIGRGLRQRSLNLVLQARLLGLGLLLLLCVAIFLTQASWLYLYPAYLLSSIIAGFYAFGAVMLRRLRRPSRGALHLRAALLITLSGLAYTAGYALDRLGVRHSFGAEGLALYALLTMIPLEVARLIDTITPLYYRTLFFTGARLTQRQLALAAALLAILVTGFTVCFYFLSAFIFGPVYRYDLLPVFLAGLMIATLSVEYFCIHRIFALHGSRYSFAYSLASLAAGALAVAVGLALGRVETLLTALLLKQLLVPLTFISLLRKADHGLPTAPAS